MKLGRIFSIVTSSLFSLAVIPSYLPAVGNDEKSIYSKTRTSRSDCIVAAFVARKGEDNARKRARLAEIIRVSGENLHFFSRLLFPTPANFPSPGGGPVHTFSPTFRDPASPLLAASTLLAAEGFICRGRRCDRPRE